MKKLLLVDAYAMIYRAYYAFIKNPRINSKGLNTSAIFGFINILEDLIHRIQPSHIGIAFDPKGKTFRHELFPTYKAQREATPEDIRKSVPIIKDIITAYRIPILEVEGFEADDVIGTLSQMAEKDGFTVFMATPDKDYAQLVSEHVFMYRPRHAGGFEQMGIAEVCAKYELQNTLQVIDLLGLMGDSSDNIPGCPGVGPKTAVKLLHDFESIENLLENTDKIKGALKTKIEENEENIRQSKFLATIKTDVPIAFKPSELLLKQPDNQALMKLYGELEFRTLMSKLQNKPADLFTTASVPVQQMSLFDTTTEQPAEQNVQTSLLFDDVQIHKWQTIDNNHYHLLQSPAELQDLAQKLVQKTEVCFDTETTSNEPMNADLVGLSFCWQAGEAYYVALPENRDECLQILTLFRPFFENQNIVKVGQNIKYDMIVLARYGLQVSGILFDTMIAHYLLQPELRHGMDYLAEIYLHYRTIRYEDLVGGKGKNQLPLRQVDTKAVADYACEDADITLRLKYILENELETNGLTRLFCDLEMPLVRVLVQMELAGVRIDKEALKTSSDMLTNELQALEKEIQTLAGQPFNVSSPKQVGEILFDVLKIDEKARKTKTGQYTTSEETLEALRSKHQIVGKILDFRAIKKLLSTYIDALPLLTNKQTGKVHTSYNQTVTATGRLSSSNPNLQNIPIRTERGKEIRKAFIPDSDCTFLSADYSQIELRIMAHLSGDERMIEAFNQGNDIHAATAAKIYNVPIELVNPDMRRKAKTANFGIIYGISAFGLAERLGISRTEAKELIDNYFATYPQISEYIEKCKAQARARGYVETLFHRKRFLPDINSHNKVVRSFAERNAVNAPIQGTAADIIKIAMVNIYRKLAEGNFGTQMTMQVHDELNFIVPLSELDSVKQIIVTEMQNAIALKVPLLVDCGTGSNWLEAH